MRIALDLSSATPARTGIGTYTYELARRLVLCRDHQWVLLFNSLRQPPPDLPEFRAPHVKLLHRRIPGPLLLKSWQHADLPDIGRLTGGPVDLFHSPATYVPPQKQGVRVTTVHDLYFLQPGSNRAPLGGGYLDWVVKNRLPELHLILTDAPSVGRQVTDLLQSSARPGDAQEPPTASPGSPGSSDAPSIVSIPLGVDSRFFEPLSEADQARVRQRYSLPAAFVLHIGGAEPRKNLERACAGYAAAAQGLPGGRPAPPLVLVGSTTGPEGSVPVPFVRLEDLPALYRMASALLFPSLHEGFGLPVLEALASGTPVLTARGVAVLEFFPAEALSGGTIRVCEDPWNADEIAAMCRAALADPMALKAGGSSGPALAAPFTWEQTARLTLAAYEKAVGRAGCL